MSDIRDLLLGLLAVETGVADIAQVRAGIDRVLADPTIDLPTALTDSGTTSPPQVEILRMMVQEQFGSLLAAQPLAAPNPDEATLDAADADLPRETAGRYLYPDGNPNAAEIGRGALGRILLAFDHHLGREVAVKELLPLQATSFEQPPGATKLLELRAARVARFLDEAKVTGQLEHPSIVPVYEIGKRLDDTVYYTMKFVRGKTLGRALEECATLHDRLKLLGHFEDMCQAIAYAHSRGVIHRDIKPDNVMLGEFGETVVLDWGLAKMRGHKDEQSEKLAREVQVFQKIGHGHTVHGQAIGTPSYMSPEMAEGAIDRIDERSDVWCLGTVLYRILTGRPPFVSGDPLRTIEMVKSEPVTPVRKLCPEAPADLAAVVEKALQRDPDRRYQTAGEIAEEIKAFQAGARIRAYEYTSYELIRRFVAKNRALSVLAVALVVFLLASSGMIWNAYQRAKHAKTVAEDARIVAEQARGDAMASKAEADEKRRMIQYNLASLLAEKAEKAFKDKNHLAAGVYSAASLLNNPFNPYSPFRDPELAAPATPETADKVAASASWYFQADVHRLLSFEAELVGHTDNVPGIAYSSDGRLLATAGSDHSVKLWDTREHRLLRSFAGHADSVRDVGFTPDGKYLVSCDRAGMIRLWETATGKEAANWMGHDGEIRGLAVAPDGTRVATASRDKLVKIWQLPSGKPEATLIGHAGIVEDAAFSSDGALLATVGRDKTVRLWRTTDWHNVVTINGHQDDILAVAFSPDGKLVASAGWDKEIKFWRTDDGAPLATLEGHEDGVRSLSFSADGRWLLSGSWDKTIRLWDVAGRRLLDMAIGHQDGVMAAVFSPNGRQAASASGDQRVKLWTVSPEKRVSVLRGHQDRVLDLSFSPDGREVASGSYDTTIKNWNRADRTAAVTLAGHDGGVSAVCYSPDGKLLASSGSDGLIKLWRVEDDSLLATLRGHEKEVRSLSFSPDGKRLASAGRDMTVRIWDVEARRLLTTFGDNADIVWTVAYMPDGRYVASAGFDKTVRLWDTQEQRLAREFVGHEHWVSGVAVSPDGKLLASASRDKTIKLWDVASGRLVRTLHGHKEWVNYVKFSPDGRYLLSGSDDRTARLWNVADGRLELIMMMSYEIAAIAFVPDNSGFAVTDKDEIVIYPLDLDFWKQDPQTLLEMAEAAAGMRLVEATLQPFARTAPPGQPTEASR